MYPTRLQVKTRWQNLLDDPSGQVFTEAVFVEAFGEAYDALLQAFLLNQVPRIELLTNVTVPPMTTSLTPAQIGLGDWGDYIYLAERPYGSTDQYRDLVPVERLPVRPASDRLGVFMYANDTFNFTAATQAIDLQVKYDSSGTAPTNDSTTITVDGALNFLANFAVGVTGQRKGYDEIAQRCMIRAVGSRYEDGVIGGELYRLVVPRVRSRQKVQIAPKPYSAFNRFPVRRAVPYVGVQLGTTGINAAANMPVQFSSVNGTITGTINGSNAVFWLTIGGITSMTVYRNGQLLTSGTDYTSLNNQITFLGIQIPQPGDVLTAEAYFSS